MTTLLGTAKRRLAAAARRVRRRVEPWARPRARRIAAVLAAQRTARWSSLPPQTRRTWQVVAGATALGLVVAGGAVAVAGPWDNGQRTAEQSWADAQGGTGEVRHGDGKDGGRGPRPAPSAPGVLTALGPHLRASSSAVGGARADTAPPPTTRGLANALEPLLDNPGLGPLRTATVWDVATGRRVYGTKQGTVATPASTIKLATAAAALTALGPGHRITTETRTGGKGDPLYLVGGGDPTLTKERLRDLARATAKELKSRGVKRTAVRYDTSAYTGPVVHPTLGRNENLAPVTPLMVEEGRLDDSFHGPAPRAADPAADAARLFADALRKAGVAVTGKPRGGRAPHSAERVAATHSAQLSALVERMLTYSDNDIAEHLARQTALAAHKPAGFKGAEGAVAERLKTLGLPLKGARFADGSGLNHADRASADLLAQVLVRASDPRHPELRPLLTGLPVAGFNGTLRSRYTDGSADSGVAAGAGLVRAKTGTLTGVNTLAGTVVDVDGRFLAFAFMTNGTKDASAAQKTLDALASAVANCGCR